MNFEKLLYLRKTRGMSQLTVALECGWDRERYRDVENGKVLRPRDSSLLLLADVFEVDIDEIILEKDEVPDKIHTMYYAGVKGRKPPQKNRVVDGKGICAFDVDGVLIQGIDYSWKEIWRFLGYEDETRRFFMKKFLSGELTYIEWFHICMDHFVRKGLKRSDFSEICEQAYLIKNLKYVLNRLKEMEISPVIICGGVDQFLYQIIPECDQLFDRIFINKTFFDPDGNLVGGDPTQFDFTGKLECFLAICEELGAAPENSVFVGDSLNDRSLAGRAGLTIAVNAKDAEIEQSFDCLIFTENAEDLLNEIVAWRSGKR